ncbi:MAG: hypothetical protein DCC52_10075 [Chloroflexi bacterium]|nr:MAG: hypothetical protein DCC52_10075 [Chloroflexota bacterium]
MTRRNATSSACTNGDVLTYDAENRLTSITVGANTTTYVYDGDGNRVKKTANGVSTFYVGNHYEVTNNVATKYCYFGKQRVAMRVGTNPTIYLHSDHLGSTSATSGASVSSQNYYAFGNIRNTTGSVPTDFGFTGQRRDASAGLMYYGARDYDPYLNRWTSPDSIVPQPSNPQALNRYAYAFNNPVNLIDPSGHAPQFPGDDPNNPDPCATDWRWENRWYEAHGYTWNDRRDDWHIGGDPTFYDEGIMDEVIGEAGITIVTPATTAQKEAIARGVSMFGRALSGGVPQLRELLGRTSVFIGPHSPVFCGSGANPCSPPNLPNMTHEVFFPEQVFVNYGVNMHMNVVHELGHVIDWQSHIGLDPQGNFAGRFSDVWSYEPLTTYAATGTFSNWERFAEAVAVYVFRQDYARVAQFRNVNGNDIQAQMDRMQALLEGWY